MSNSDLDLRPVAVLDDEARGDFVVRVYQHLMAAFLVFVGIEAIFLYTPIAIIARIWSTPPSGWRKPWTASCA